MNRYELMYIIDVALEDEPRKALIERVSTLITDNGGEVDKVDEWGKRRLAYPINYKNEGYYVLANFSANPDLPKEIERVLQINENVLRYLIIRLEQKHTSVKPKPAPVRPVYSRPPEPPAPESAEENAPQAPTLEQTVAVEAGAEQPLEGQAKEQSEETVAVETTENADA